MRSLEKPMRTTEKSTKFSVVRLQRIIMEGAIVSCSPVIVSRDRMGKKEKKERKKRKVDAEGAMTLWLEASKV